MSMTEYSQATGLAVAESTINEGAEAAPAAAVSTTDSEYRFAFIELDLIVESPTNPRKHFDEAALLELAESIKDSDVHEPVQVRPLPADRLAETSAIAGRSRRPEFELVFGARRFRGSKLAGKRTIPAMIRRLTNAQVLTMQLVENLQREDLTELEEAEGYDLLIRETGMRKEDVGEKIGKSRGYVYARLKLLNLSHDGREALRKGLHAGGLDFSRALVVARVPDSTLQAKALAEAMRRDPATGNPKMSERELKAWVHKNLMLKLDAARFNIVDATLIERAGSCKDCEKRTGANPDLFSDVDSADVCTDPKCFHEKEAAHDAADIEAARKLGKKVISGAEARELMPEKDGPIAGYVDLDKNAYHLGVLGTSVRDRLGKDVPEATIMINPHDGMKIALIKESTARKLINKAKQEKKAAEQAKEARKAERAPIEQRPEYAARWLGETVDMIDVFLRSEESPSLPVDVLRVVLHQLVEEEYDGVSQLALDLPVDCSKRDETRRVLALADNDVIPALLRFMLHRDAYDHEREPNEVLKASAPRSIIAILADHAGVDIRNVQADTKAAMQREERELELEAKAAKAAPRVVKPTPAAGISPTDAWPFPPKAGPAKAEGAGGGKGKGKPKIAARKSTTEGEARSAIAAAMQAAEGEEKGSGGAAAPQGNEAATPVAAGPAGAIGVGSKVEVTDAVTQKHLVSSIGLQGEVTQRVGQAWMVNLRTKQRKRVLRSFMPEELKVIA